MKRHHIVGIFAGICGIGLTVRHALSADIIEALINLTMFSVVAVSTFFKDKLPPRWSHWILPFGMCVVVICLFFFKFVFAFYFSS